MWRNASSRLLSTDEFLLFVVVSDVVVVVVVGGFLVTVVAAVAAAVACGASFSSPDEDDDSGGDDDVVSVCVWMIRRLLFELEESLMSWREPFKISLINYDYNGYELPVENKLLIELSSH